MTTYDLYPPFSVGSIEVSEIYNWSSLSWPGNRAAS